ncbi:endonuclease/exonuclease/phosphatase family protein [Parapedobacter sp. 10938]|uniref:endonuclease/exonuclease/phosphatase family protein n=1 Tax=Parapedobacter flavus TaxID=3110225 RepID=UPI002DBD1B12|nr:endonuclease/exonuclease/phosphatase family protein [Parapedobacter sp. 10938]MEC3880589.1 endonuclease/exonuclease/phosphatase family protein [Parapedobacter sp. 10938]
MRITPIVFLCLLLTVSCSSYAQLETERDQQSSVQLKVLSYNLRFGELASLEELAAFIAAEKPDIVALQEVDCRTYRDRAPAQNGKDFATELAFRTGMIPAYGKTIPYAGGYYGIAILSKYPLAKVERIYLPKTANGKEQRAVLVADVEYQEGKYITFASTHLDYTNTEERQGQVKKLNEVLLESSYPVIVAGDFNAQPDAVEISAGMGDWKIVSNLEPTVPANNPRNTIDYIFCYPKAGWEVVSSTTNRVELSDHLPISAVVELKN